MIQFSVVLAFALTNYVDDVKKKKKKKEDLLPRPYDPEEYSFLGLSLAHSIVISE